MGIKAAIATEKRRLEDASASLAKSKHPGLRRVAQGLREAADDLERDCEADAMALVAEKIRAHYRDASPSVRAGVKETAETIAGWLEESAKRRKKRTPAESSSS